MELRDYMDAGATKAGSLTALGRIIGLSQPDASNARKHRRTLPLDAAIRLADYIEADRMAVIAANELATEKREEKRAFWSPFVSTARTASIALAVLSVTNFVTQTSAEAAPLLVSIGGTVCIM